MKKLLFIALLILPFLTFGEDFKQLQHSSTSYVDDFADLLTPEEEKQIDKAIRIFKQRSTVEFSVVTVKNLNGYDVADFALELFRKWGVGGKSNNGVMILLSVDPRKLRSEIGYGLEGDLPDGLTNRYHAEHAVPYLKNNEYYKGITALLTAYMQRLDPVEKQLRLVEEAKQKEESQKSFDAFLDTLMWIGIIVIAILTMIFSYRRIRRLQQEALRAKQLAIEQERLNKLRKEAEWSSALHKIKCFQDIVKECEKFGIKDPILNKFKSFDNHDLNVTDDLSRNAIYQKISNIINDDINQVEKQVVDIKQAVKFLEDIEKDINNSKARNITLQDRLKELISKHPDWKFDYDDVTYTSLEKNYTNVLANIIEYIIQGKKDIAKQDYKSLIEKVSFMKISYNAYKNVINIITAQISKIEQAQHEVKNTHRLLSDFENKFNRLKNLSYISDKFKQSETVFQQHVQDFKSKFNDSLSLVQKLSLIAIISNRLFHVISVGEAEELKEKQRLQAIEDERQEFLRKQKREQDRKDEEERQRRRRIQEAEEDARRSSYSSSSSFGSSSSSSSDDSSFGGGSSGGGGSSSDY